MDRLFAVGVSEVVDGVAGQRAIGAVVQPRVLVDGHVDQVELLEEC